MRTYEYPLGVTFRASTPEHAAARVFGGKPSDYLATIHTGSRGNQWAEVTRPNGEFVDDIPMFPEAKRGVTLGTVTSAQGATLAARKHIGDNVVQVSTAAVPGGTTWRSATALEATTFAPLPIAAMPL